MAITTAMATSFKQELFSTGHCFNATVTPTCSVASANTAATVVSAMTGVAVGMVVTGTSVGANTVVARITSSVALTLSVATTAAITGGAITIAGDVFKMALIKQGMAGTYSTASTNYTDITGNTDEVTNASGTSYTATGQALTNVTATTGGVVAYINFSPNPSWTTATFSTAGCMIYNSTIRNGSSSLIGSGRACSVHDFGGSQQVSAGTFTVLMPTADSSTAVSRFSIRISW